MNEKTRAKWRRVGLVAVVVAPLLFYAVWRVRASGEAVGIVWAEPVGAPAPYVYQPRNHVFDSSRKLAQLTAARGERVGFLVRLQARVALANVQLTLDPLPKREKGSAIVGPVVPPPLQATARSVVRAPDGGAVSFVAPQPLAMPAGSATEWLVEVAVPPALAPGLYGGLVYVRAGDVGIERLLFSLYVSGAVLGGCAPVAGERLAVWKEAPASPPGVVPLRAACDDAPPPTLAALEQQRARDDRRYLDLLRSRGEPVVEGLVARVVSSPPATAEAWLGVRSELIGLLNAPGTPAAPAKTAAGVAESGKAP